MNFSTFNSAQAFADFIVPAGAAVGSVTVDGAPVAFTAAPGSPIRTRGAPVTANSVVVVGLTYAIVPSFSRAVPNRTMILGDSVANHNFFESFDGVKTYDARNMSRFLHYLDGLLGGRLHIVQNAGVSGQRTDEMLARWDNDVLGVGFYSGLGSTGGPYGTLLPGVSPFSPQLLFVIAGLNDMIQGRSKEQTLSGIIALWKKGLAMGAKVFGATLPMYAGATSEMLELNKNIKAAARELGVVMGIPFYEVMMDPTFNGIQNKTGYTQDEGTSRLHPNNRAGYEAAKLAAVIVEPYTTPHSPLPVSNWDSTVNNPASKNISANALLTGTTAASGTNVTGNWVPGCAVNAAGNGATTRAFSLTAHPQGYGQCLNMLVVTTGAEGGADVMLPSEISRYVAGGTYRVMAELTLTKGDGVTALDGTENCTGVELRLRAGFSDGTNYWAKGMAGTSATLTNGVVVGCSELLVVKSALISPPAALGAPTIFRASFAVSTSGASGAGGINARIGRVWIERVA
jgi:hypothetical protein